MNHLCEQALHNLSDSDMEGITIQNRENVNNKPIGISFRRKDQVLGDVIWSVIESSNRILDITHWNFGRVRTFG